MILQSAAAVSKVSLLDACHSIHTTFTTYMVKKKKTGSAVLLLKELKSQSISAAGWLAVMLEELC